MFLVVLACLEIQLEEKAEGQSCADHHTRELCTAESAETSQPFPKLQL